APGGALSVTNANGGMNIPAGAQELYGRTLNTMGAVTISSGAEMFFGYGGVVNNSVGGTWTIAGNYPLLTTTGGGSFNNAGTFAVSAATFTIQVQPVFNNTGAVQVNAGTVQFLGGGGGSGTYAAAMGTTLAFLGGAYTFGGAISGPGTLTASGATLNFNAGSSESNLPAFSPTGSTITLAS